MKALVTGAQGFAGSWLARALLDEGAHQTFHGAPPSLQRSLSITASL